MAKHSHSWFDIDGNPLLLNSTKSAGHHVATQVVASQLPENLVTLALPGRNLNQMLFAPQPPIPQVVPFHYPQRQGLSW